MSRDPFDNKDRLPPWLRDVPLPPKPASEGKPAASEQQAGWADQPFTPATDSNAAASSLPDWLRDTGPASEPAPPLEPPIPDWLRDENRTPDAPQPTSADDLPSWLRGETQKPATSQPSDANAVPEWLGSEVNEPATRQPSDADNTLDWLRDPGPPPTPPATESLPAWLAETPSQQSASDTAASESDSTPDWLRQLSGPAASPTSVEPVGLQSPPKPSQRSSGDEIGSSSTDSSMLSDSDLAAIPSWLRDIPTDEIRRVMESDEEEGITAEPFSFEGISEPPTQEPKPGLPSWLASTPGDVPPDSEVVPDWLKATSDQPTPPTDITADDASVPSWLQNLDSTPGSDEPSVSPPSWLTEQIPTADFEQPEEASQPSSDQAGTMFPAPSEALPSWLQDNEQPAQSEPDTAPQDLPAWLRADVPTTPPPAEPPAAAPVEDLPAWLRADVPATPPPAEPPAAAPVEDLPPWLRADVPATPPPAEPPVAAPVEDLPDWLRADTPAAPAIAGPQSVPEQPAFDAATPPMDAQDVPEWLRADIQAAPPSAGAEDIPEWLRTEGPDVPVEPAPSDATPWTAPEPDAAPAEASEDLPPWLSDAAGLPLPTAGAPGDRNLPEWLRGVDADLTQPSAAATQGLPTPPQVPPQTPESAEPKPGGFGDWFDESEQLKTPDRAPAASESEFFGGAELPAWLRTPEAEPAAEAKPSEARSLDWLTRLGATDEDGPAAESTAAAHLPPPPAVVRTPSQLEALSLLERLAAEPFPEPAPMPAPAAPSIWRRIGIERVLYLLLLVGLVAGLAVPAATADLQVPPQAPGASELLQRVDALSENDVVLVAYEWDSRRISELGPLEDAVLSQLIQKQVKLILMSTDPQGTLLMFDLRDDLVAAGYPQYSVGYLTLGYRPGGELALRSLAQDFRRALQSDFLGNDATVSALATGLDTGKPLQTLNDLSMLLVLADDASDVQGWMEQIHSSATDVPLAFLLPAEAAPIVQPYLRRPGVYYLAGKQGALAYQSLSGTDSTSAARIAQESGEQRLGILIFIALLLIGALAVGISGAAARRRKRS